ncbi:hypothetical protein BB559_000665 [Furculomyces boomerangus]|uniref:FAS1 domain-containing protein n=1 Tax=Furculomyces boomerangus TaxID=61424 RepID=A0A2T9Z4H5_9FUNG|nr:hypothetical protein BB559_000665 [Furculomyces boomerangus]
MANLFENVILRAFPDFENRQFTMFAPTNNMLMGNSGSGPNTDQFIAQLSYHILSDTVTTDVVGQQVQFYPSLLTDKKFVNLPNGAPQSLGIFGSESNGYFIVDGEYMPKRTLPRIIKANIIAGQGVIHIIDKMLTIPKPVSTVLGTLPNFNEFNNIFKGLSTSERDEIDNSAGITGFVAENSGFGGSLVSSEEKDNYIKGSYILGKVFYTSEMEGIYNYNSAKSTDKENPDIRIQRLDDGRITVNNAEISIPNILVKNGVIHGLASPMGSISTKKISSEDNKRGKSALQSTTGFNDVLSSDNIKEEIRKVFEKMFPGLVTPTSTQKTSTQSTTIQQQESVQALDVDLEQEIRRIISNLRNEQKLRLLSTMTQGTQTIVVTGTPLPEIDRVVIPAKLAQTKTVNNVIVDIPISVPPRTITRNIFVEERNQ